MGKLGTSGGRRGSVGGNEDEDDDGRGAGLICRARRMAGDKRSLMLK